MKKKLLAILSTLSILALNSCQVPSIGIFFPSDSSSSAPTTSNSPSSSVIETPSNNSSSTSISQDQIDNPYRYGRDIREKYNNNYLPSLPSRGNSKMLVVPVLLKGESFILGEDSVKSTLNKAFFGKSEETGFESVSSYYYKSSYGELNIQGEVTSILNSNYTLSQLKRAEDSTSITDAILKEAYDKFFLTSKYKVSDYDSNSDGYIDAIYLVYLTPYDGKYDGLWAYTYWGLDETYHSLGAYSWSSYYFATTNPGYSKDKPDAHPYIHETGHLLSLDDYYDVDGTTAPTGGLTMMDLNILDHDSFTKYALGWTTPKVISKDTDIKDELTIELKPFESSGESLLIANNFNGSSFDEYLIVEFYTPTGLNELDSKVQYETAKGFTTSGIKIYHVDQRLIKLDYTSQGWVYDNTKFYTPDRLDSLSSYSYYQVGASNSANYSLTGYDLITLMDASSKNGNNVFQYENKNATNASLFTESSKSFLETFRNFKFHSGDKLPYDIKVDSISSTSATIKITSI